MSVSQASSVTSGLFSFIESSELLNIPSSPEDGDGIVRRRRPLRVTLGRLFEPQVRIAAAPTVSQSIKAIVLSSFNLGFSNLPPIRGCVVLGKF
ncbi:hypothetical protein HYDPIDRAFT_43734 [Hydnomerulius pinastri MD-312]|uniref:Uncharacterized protein n=1 Tax=Hydnomerulius pinastri MD-312 TaxID=994086 RepID=A0A0C9W9Z7_9AGAM|nr:hypothetical protein HYDPIDRAFT_43734 [Hydnomerulius pinastri MD-312]